jgi:hypothetical protein
MRSARAPKPQPNSKTFIPGNDGQVAYGDECGLKIMGKPTETQKSEKKMEGSPKMLVETSMVCPFSTGKWPRWWIC